MNFLERKPPPLSTEMMFFDAGTKDMRVVIAVHFKDVDARDFIRLSEAQAAQWQELVSAAQHVLITDSQP